LRHDAGGTVAAVFEDGGLVAGPAVALRQSHDIIHFSIIGRTISSEFAEEQKESFGRRAESRIAEPLGRLLRLGKLLLDRPSANKLLADCVFRMALGNSR
jgi:hypothetical protein